MQDAQSQRFGFSELRRIAHQDCEFVSAKSRDKVRRSRHPFDAFSGGAKHDVAGLVTERVIDELEIVEIKQK
jgi:hypothetical protein